MTRQQTAFFTFALACGLAAQDPDAARTDRADQLAHYARVERELRAAPKPADPARAAARERVIDCLREYRLRGVFGINDDFPGQRQPYFVDDDGRRCAVAFLLDRTGHGHLTEEVAAAANHAWVADLAGSVVFLRWLDEHGLSLAEAARIQAPSVGNGGGWGGRGGRGGWVTPPEPPPPPVWEGPANGTRGSAGGAQPGGAASGSGRPATSRPALPGAAPAATPGRSGPATPRGVPVVQLESEAWLPWFDAQAPRWLPPRRVAPSPTTATHSDARRVDAAAVARAALTDADAGVRAAAVLALGRLGRADASVRALLEDPSYEVRCAAVVALASAGTPAAMHPLLALASDDAEPTLRPLAIAALGGAPRRDGAMDRVAADLLAGSRDAALLAGAAAYARLAADREPDAGAPGIASARDRVRGDENVALRALLATAFGPSDDVTTVAALTQAVSGKGLEMRRAAAAALGRSHAALALPSLQTAFELEHDLATCAQLLLAIGEHGDAAARAFLIEQMKDGRKPLRAWAAVALGVFGRDRGDKALAQLVQQGRLGERNRDHAGLWLLALGLLRDASSFDVLREQCAEGSSSETRAAAVWALGLLQDPRAHALLAERVRVDQCTFVRGIACEVLAAAAGPGAVPVLAAVVAEDGATDVRQAAAFALGATGDETAADRLQRLAADPRGEAALRAAALRGLGRLLAHDGEPDFARIAFGGPAELPPVFRYLAQIQR